MSENILHPLNNQSNNSSWSLKKVILLSFVVLFLGMIFGSFFGNIKNKNSTGVITTSTSKKEGVIDKKTFKDNAEGVLREGGIDGEGSFHLERPGGKSQYVYLTSSTIDLSKYIGKKIRVWGQTFSAEKAGWLMDVGFVEILD
jgi:hypothetical protein